MRMRKLPHHYRLPHLALHKLAHEGEDVENPPLRFQLILVPAQAGIIQVLVIQVVGNI